MRFFIIAALLLAGPATAQIRATAPDGFKFMSQGEIDKLVSTPEPGRVYGATFMNDHENYYVEFVKRLDHGNMVELHPHWVDQITILSGEGMVTYGGTISTPISRPMGKCAAAPRSAPRPASLDRATSSSFRPACRTPSTPRRARV